jgi:outer membrane protein insertion porin family
LSRRVRALVAVLALLAGGLPVLSASTSAPAAAQSLLAGGNISEIRIEGSQRIEPQTTLTYLGLQPGDPFDPVRLDKALQALFATGLFADAVLRREGDALIVTVVENPILNQVVFEGNERLDDETLQAEIQSRPRVVYTRTRVQSDAQRILELYRRSGRYAATVEPKIIELPQNRVDLVFEIDEGESSGIKSINFIGNREYSDSTLRGEITTSESAFWRILSSTDTYDPDRLNFDRELLRRFYLSEGYADFRVLSVLAELSPDREGFIITFTVEEGEVYTFGKIDVVTTLKNLDPATLQDKVTTIEGDTYDATAVELTVANLTEAVGNLGYAFVDINPRVDRDAANRIIGITYEINEGPKVFVERIDIEGNVRTLDEVIRREFRLVEGDAFNATKLRRSRQRIQNLGYFRTVAVDNVQGSAPDKTIVKVSVEEQSTGDFTFGAGFSTDSGPLGNIGLRERNLLGRGQDLRLNFTLSGVSSQIDLSFTEPYFLGKNLSAGFDIFRTTREQEESDFKEERIGFGLRAGFNWDENLRQVVRYVLERKDITEVDSSVSAVIADDEGVRIKSAIGQTLSIDTRDSRFDPTDGYIVSLDNEFAGLGGDSYFIKSTLGGAYYIPVLEEVTLKFGAEVGAIYSIQDTRVSDRFFIGGPSLRGFAVGGVGARDTATDDALGAKYYYTGTAELVFPLGLPEEFSIRGRLFTDIGAAWGIDGEESFATVEDSQALRAAVGAGISWDSPFGPIQVDIGYALLKEDFDETEVFRFSFGTKF